MNRVITWSLDDLASLKLCLRGDRDFLLRIYGQREAGTLKRLEAQLEALNDDADKLRKAAASRGIPAGKRKVVAKLTVEYVGK